MRSWLGKIRANEMNNSKNEGKSISFCLWLKLKNSPQHSITIYKQNQVHIVHQQTHAIILPVYIILRSTFK